MRVRAQLAGPSVYSGSLPIDGAGSWLSCGFLICHTCTALPNQSHQYLSGNEYSYLSCRLSGTGCLNLWASLHCQSLSLTFALLNFVYLSFFVFSDPICFSAHLVDIKAVFFTCKLCCDWILDTHIVAISVSQTLKWREILQLVLFFFWAN